MPERAAVFGCGPAGMIAAHVLARRRYAVDVFSFKAVKSQINGAQYLHQPIWHLDDTSAPREPSGDVQFIKEGDRGGYAAKVYDDPTAPCSWDSFPSGNYPMWSLRETYSALWERYKGLVQERFLNPRIATDLAADYDLTISTVPLPAICYRPEHKFPSAEVWIRPEAPEKVKEGQVWYSGDPKTAWYRSSRLDGQGSTEYGHFVIDAAKGVKPLDTDCDCHPEIVKAGRFGSWRKGILLHHVQDIAHTAIALTRREP